MAHLIQGFYTSKFINSFDLKIAFNPTHLRPSSGNAWDGATANDTAEKADTVSIHTTKTLSNSVTGDSEQLISEEDPPKGCWHSFTKGVGG